LKPWEFWRCTPAELDALIDAANRRQEKEWYRVAWLATHIYRAFVGKKARKITPEKLLGKKTKPPLTERDTESDE